MAELGQWEARLRNGNSLVIHCRQGVGRSALLAASLLRLAGASTEDAWSELRRARQVKTPDTAEQERWIAGISAEIAGRTT
jgi:protein-tyrosine phosphatase